MANKLRQRTKIDFPAFLKPSHLREVIGMENGAFSLRTKGHIPFTDEQLLQVRAYFEILTEDVQIQSIWGNMIEASSDIFESDEYERIFNEVKAKFYGGE